MTEVIVICLFIALLLFIIGFVWFLSHERYRKLYEECDKELRELKENEPKPEQTIPIRYEVYNPIVQTIKATAMIPDEIRFNTEEEMIERVKHDLALRMVDEITHYLTIRHDYDFEHREHQIRAELRVIAKGDNE